MTTATKFQYHGPRITGVTDRDANPTVDDIHRRMIEAWDCGDGNLMQVLIEELREWRAVAR